MHREILILLTIILTIAYTFTSANIAKLDGNITYQHQRQQIELHYVCSIPYTKTSVVIHDEQVYNKQLQKGEIHCGVTRKYNYSLRKYSNIPRATCGNITLANEDLHRIIRQICSESSSSSSIISNSSSTHVIIYTGILKHYRDIYASIMMHSLLGSRSVIEVWTNKKLLAKCIKAFESLQQHQYSSMVTCKSIPDSIIGYKSKIYSLLHTNYTDVVYMDSDNLPLVNVDTFFTDYQYRFHGAVLWPDFWGQPCQNDIRYKDVDHKYKNINKGMKSIYYLDMYVC